MVSRRSFPRVVLATAGLLGLTVVSGGAAHAALFPQLSARYPVGDPQAANPVSWTEGPKALAAGDFDGDGIQDVATANLDGSVSVLLGGPAGLRDQLLVPSTGLLEMASLRDIVASDLNGDGVLDAAVADITGSVVVLLGRGDGVLSPFAEAPVGPARALAAGDLNGDGRVDLLVATSPADCDQRPACFDVGPPALRSLSILIGAGDGTFAAPSPIVIGYPGCFYDVELCDVDSDGDLDALALDFGARCLADDPLDRKGLILIYAGAGDGTFRHAQDLAIRGAGPRAFTTAYVDERLVDGKPPPGALPDLVVACRDGNVLETFRNLGGLRFELGVAIPAGDSPRAVAAGDLNGDGLVELVATNRNTNAVSVFRGLGDARFGSPLALAAGTSPRELALADLNGDGALDAAVVNRISEDVSLFTGRAGLVGFLVPETYYPAGITPVGLSVADFDEDGLPDVATANLRSHDIRVRRNAGDGSLGPESVYPVSSEPTSIVAEDLDGDGHVDLAAACLGGGTADISAPDGSLVTLLGRGDGSFSGPIITGAARQGFRPYSLRIGDLSGDGKPDAAVGGLSGDLVLFEGRGDGGFGAGRALPSEREGRPITLTLGDLDGDGLEDIATSGGQVILNDGALFLAGGSGIRKSFPVERGDWVVECSDLDEDGILDLIVALTFVEPDPIAVHFGLGGGEFAPPTIYPTGMGVVAIDVADMDGDGVLDIVSGNRCTADVTILRGLGDRTFERLETVRTYSVEGVAVVDLNGDGRPDLAGVGLALWTVMSGGETVLTDPKSANPSGILPAEGIYINEVMALNHDTIVDGAGRTPDWVEIYNHTGGAVNLSGWTLRQYGSDGEEHDWRFPDGTILAAAGRLLVFCEFRGFDDPRGLLCTEFELSADGEGLSLLDREGKERDRVDFPPMPSDVSYARFVDGARYLGYNPVPTPAVSNVPPANLDPSVKGKDPVPIGSGGVMLVARTFDDIGLSYAAVHFRLEGEREFSTLLLSDDGLHADGEPGDGLFGAALPPLAPETRIEYYFRVVDLEGQVATDPDDPADESALFRVTLPPAARSLRITEAVADNRTGLLDGTGVPEDWVEVANCGQVPIDVGRTVLSKKYRDVGEAYIFPPGTVLPPGGRTVVFCDKDPEEGPLHADFRLGREGDRLYLWDGEEPWTIFDVFAFGTAGPDVAYGRDGCDGEPMILERPTPGAPNAQAAPLFLRGDANSDGALDLSDAVRVLLHLFRGGTAVGCADAADANDDGGLNIADPIFTLGHLFLGGPPPPEPFETCAGDPTPDSLACLSPPSCR